MQKVIIIIIVFTITLGCSVTRRKADIGLKDSDGSKSNNLLNNVIEQNITNNSFFITKADIEIVAENESKEFVASIKFRQPDKYLVSLKSKAGIEALRIFLTNDTILINDRFNRILYYGSTDKIYKRFGINYEFVSLLFGDYKDIRCVRSDFIICENDKINIKCKDRGTEMFYEIDCAIRKVVNIKLADETGKNEMNISFSDFSRFDDILVPQRIDISGIPNIKLMNINIRKIEYPWEGLIEFVPGNKYEKIEIL